MSPIQHGEVFVTEDGAETDLDIGHYERFADENLTKDSNTTAGRIYWNVISNERAGDYGGGTVQIIPHITDEIKKRIYRVGDEKKTDVVIQKSAVQSAIWRVCRFRGDSPSGERSWA